MKQKESAQTIFIANILFWLFGLLFTACGIVVLLKGGKFAPSILILLTGLTCLPISWKKIQEYFESKKLPTSRWWYLPALIVLFLISLPDNQNQSASNAQESEEILVVEPEKLNKDNFFVTGHTSSAAQAVCMTLYEEAATYKADAGYWSDFSILDENKMRLIITGEMQNGFGAIQKIDGFCFFDREANITGFSLRTKSGEWLEPFEPEEVKRQLLAIYPMERGELFALWRKHLESKNAIDSHAKKECKLLEEDGFAQSIEYKNKYGAGADTIIDPYYTCLSTKDIDGSANSINYIVKGSSDTPYYYKIAGFMDKGTKEAPDYFRKIANHLGIDASKLSLSKKGKLELDKYWLQISASSKNHISYKFISKNTPEELLPTFFSE